MESLQPRITLGAHRALPAPLVDARYGFHEAGREEALFVTPGAGTLSRSGKAGTQPMDWRAGETRELTVDEFDQRLARYRLQSDADDRQAMVASRTTSPSMTASKPGTTKLFGT
jgi:hypothetical protein